MHMPSVVFFLPECGKLPNQLKAVMINIDTHEYLAEFKPLSWS